MMSGKWARLLMSVLLFGAPLLIHTQGVAAGTAATENEAQHYYCPMHPDVKSEKPGSCSKCGMKLALDSHSNSAPPPSPSHWGSAYFPNVPLTTQDGNTVHFYDDLLKGKIVAIDLIYTQCKANCPLETARLAQVQRMLGDRVGRDIFFYSISIDPETDTPEVLKAYAEKFHVQPGWTFLTGKKHDIDLISKKLGLSSQADKYDADGHTPTLLVGYPDKVQWMNESALDNPRYLAIALQQFLASWQRQAGAPQVASYTQAPPIQMEKSAYLFRTRCAACHTIGQGDAVGPDLAGVVAARGKEWLTKYIAQPDKMLVENDAVATRLYEKYKPLKMPNLGLSSGDVAALISYLEKPAPGHSEANIRKEAAANTTH